MESINQFSAQRFTLLIKRYFVLNYKPWLIGLGALSGVLLLVSLINAYASGGSFNFPLITSLGSVFIFIVGFMTTSSVFKEIHTPARGQFFLTLPATTIEKLFSHWFITSIAYILIANIILYLVLLFANGLSNLIWGMQWSFFNPFSIGNLELMGQYIVAHSLFFLGAVYFRKNNFLKTLLSLFALYVFLGIILGLSAWAIFGSGGVLLDGNEINHEMQLQLESNFKLINRIFFAGIMAPFCLLVSYFKFKEREV